MILLIKQNNTFFRFWPINGLLFADNRVSRPKIQRYLYNSCQRMDVILAMHNCRGTSNDIIWGKIKPEKIF